MKVLITENRLLDVIVKFIGPLEKKVVSKMRRNDTYGEEEQWISSRNGDIVIIYDEISDDIAFSIKTISDITTQLGLDYKSLKPLLTEIVERITNKKIRHLNLF
jgi:hypothetical protein